MSRRGDSSDAIVAVYSTRADLYAMRVSYRYSVHTSWISGGYNAEIQEANFRSRRADPGWAYGDFPGATAGEALALAVESIRRCHPGAYAVTSHEGEDAAGGERPSAVTW